MVVRFSDGVVALLGICAWVVATVNAANVDAMVKRRMMQCGEGAS